MSTRSSRPMDAGERWERRFQHEWHGSWLEMAEFEVGVPLSQCLDRRIPDKAAVVTDVAAWQANRNEHNTIADL